MMWFAEIPLVPLVVDNLEAACGVDIVRERDELRHRYLRPDVRRLAVQKVDDDRLLDDRIKAVRVHVVPADPRDVPDLQRRAQPVNLFASACGTDRSSACASSA